MLCNLHSLDLARAYCDRLVGLADGRVVFDGRAFDLTEDVAQQLYGLEAGEVMDRQPAARTSVPRGVEQAATLVA